MLISDPKEMTNIVMLVIFVAVFLGIFYFAYVVKVEEHVVANQIDYLVDNLTGDLQVLLSDDQKAKLRFAINNIPKPDLSAQDAEVEKYNDQVFWTAVKILAVGFIVGMVCIYAASKYWKFELAEMIKNNLIILVFIGITEYLFLNYFAESYISADPNFIKRTVLIKLATI